MEINQFVAVAGDPEFCLGTAKPRSQGLPSSREEERPWERGWEQPLLLRRRSRYNCVTHRLNSRKHWVFHFKSIFIRFLVL